jgi:hypothetical protein
MAGNFVDLSKARLVAQGHINLVYEHDDLPGALIKVFRPELISETGQKLYRRQRRGWKFRRRLGAFHILHREIWEILALYVKPANRAVQWPVARIYGFAETQKGLGVVVEKLSAPDGGLAPTLLELVRKGRFSSVHREALERFFDQLIELHVCLHDVHEKNIVFAGEAGQGGRFVAVDGLGVRAWIPLRDWFRSVNAWSIRRKSRRIWNLVDSATGSQTR